MEYTSSSRNIPISKKIARVTVRKWVLTATQLHPTKESISYPYGQEYPLDVQVFVWAHQWQKLSMHCSHDWYEPPAIYYNNTKYTTHTADSDRALLGSIQPKEGTRRTAFALWRYNKWQVWHLQLENSNQIQFEELAGSFFWKVPSSVRNTFTLWIRENWKQKISRTKQNKVQFWLTSFQTLAWNQITIYSSFCTCRYCLLQSHSVDHNLKHTCTLWNW